MSDTLTVVEAVNKKDTKAGPCWEVTLLGGTIASTFDPDIGTKAEGMVNQSVAVELNVQKKGRYENTFLNSIEAVEGGGTPQAVTPSPAQQASQSRGGDDEVGPRIARTSSLRMAVDEAIAAEQPGVIDWAAVDTYFEFITTGKKPE